MTDAIAGLIIGVIIGKASEPHHRHPPRVEYPPVVVVQPLPPVVVYPRVPQVIHTPGIMCPAGTAPMYEPRYDSYGRTYYSFMGCR